MGAIDIIRSAVAGPDPRQHPDTEWDFREVHRRGLRLPAMASGNPEFQSVYTFSWGRGFLGIEERAADV